jgi:YHS domain-containing protein
MEGLLSLLLFAAFFYFMMRYGCGAHMVHGHAGHGSHRGAEHGPPQARHIDPVCGMEVQQGQGYTVRFEGREYWLCSRVCLDKFDANPAQFVTAQGGQ